MTSLSSACQRLSIVVCRFPIKDYSTPLTRRMRSVKGLRPRSAIMPPVMERNDLKKMLQEVRRGSLGVAGALERLKNWPTEHLPFAAIDHHRGLRQGQAEVVFCPGK